MTKSYLDNLTYKIIGAAIEVHKNLGPGLLESVYQTCLEHEFILQGINFISQPIVPIHYKGIELESNLRCDFLVSNNIVIELKSVEIIKPIFQAQLLTYMKLLEAPKGILINFNCKNIFKEGQQTFVNEYFKLLPE
jgi:GxxExxY protein